jgi:hypothetical protein
MDPEEAKRVAAEQQRSKEIEIGLAKVCVLHFLLSIVFAMNQLGKIPHDEVIAMRF